ncbi:ATP-binding protein [Arabiibacter massiliensis]|uniref:ATP-binding protein n=1 Tax=Arabiibacter massiliensis TaxID=1870985 RepID=UPI0009BB369B|nr:ATP-binding protein [Arabiibacter massiliensis]
MDNQIEQADHSSESADGGTGGDAYALVNAVARIALYDDLRSAPRVTEIQPAPTAEFIESLASKVYEQARSSGGTVPYTVIREVSENFIHARFAEVIVSILDNGNTIRFADQGPGIPQKEKAQLPGFTSAIEPMKRYIRGVGSGLPIVKEYLDFSHGTITIEDNLGTGSVVTISLIPGAAGGRAAAPQEEPPQPQAPQMQPYPQPYQPQPLPQAGAYQPAQPMPQGYPYPAPPQPAPYPGAYPQPAYPQPAQPPAIAPLVPPLTKREREFLPIFLSEGALGVTDLVNITGSPQSSTHSALTKLEQAGLIEKTVGQKRILTQLGYQVANSL